MSEQQILGSLHICCSLVRLVSLNDFKSELRYFSKSVIDIPKEGASDATFITGYDGPRVH